MLSVIIFPNPSNIPVCCVPPTILFVPFDVLFIVIPVNLAIDVTVWSDIKLLVFVAIPTNPPVLP